MDWSAVCVCVCVCVCLPQGRLTSCDQSLWCWLWLLTLWPHRGQTHHLITHSLPPTPCHTHLHTQTHTELQLSIRRWHVLWCVFHGTNRTLRWLICGDISSEKWLLIWRKRQFPAGDSWTIWNKTLSSQKSNSNVIIQSWPDPPFKNR